MNARRRRRPSVSIRTQCMFRLLHRSLITTGPRFGDPHLDRGILFPILSTVVYISPRPRIRLRQSLGNFCISPAI